MTYTQSMMFSDLYGDVLALRFNGTSASAAQQTQAKRAVNHALARIWNAAEWTFKEGNDAVTATAGSAALSGLASDFGVARALYTDDGTRLRYLTPRQFYNAYGGTAPTGTPESYTIINQAITVSPTPTVTSTAYLLVYEKRLTNLTADGDIPTIPAQHHYLIVDGALSHMLRLYNDFTWQFQEQAFLSGINDMRTEWLADERGEPVVWGRDTVEDRPWV